MEFDSQSTQVRRKDRVVEDDEWIKAFLQQSKFGVLAMSANEQPFVNTNIFAYDPQRHALYIHHASEGRMVATLTANPRVCFTCAEMGRLLPAARTRGFSVEYASVVIFGQAYRVEDLAEMTAGLKLIMAKYAPHLTPGQDYRELMDDELNGVNVYRVDISAWSAKRKTAGEDFPGAYRLEDVVAG